MKLVRPRPYADPEAAARKLMEIANSVEPVQDAPIPYREDQRAVLTGRAARRPNTAPGREVGDRARLALVA